MEKRIIIGHHEHAGELREVYIPQILAAGRWVNAMTKGYILKNSFNPLISCGCGSGCKECKNTGLKKGESIDLYDVADSIADNAIEQYMKAQNFIVGLHRNTKFR